ncbi:hypothetical protein CEXT_485961 [Caerostris extrusa]|uniref:Uncharacterized protein n=1 Tax=Caerostris extrusa TaxID=172846 RepID=A0AAV4TKV7_CAEEX|nr:hypothetical protein CEXT_485961 [Caerostris extrusa]
MRLNGCIKLNQNRINSFSPHFRETFGQLKPLAESGTNEKHLLGTINHLARKGNENPTKGCPLKSTVQDPVKGWTHGNYYTFYTDSLMIIRYLYGFSMNLQREAHDTSDIPDQMCNNLFSGSDSQGGDTEYFMNLMVAWLFNDSQMVKVAF